VTAAEFDALSDDDKVGLVLLAGRVELLAAEFLREAADYDKAALAYPPGTFQRGYFRGRSESFRKANTQLRAAAQ